MAVGDARIGMVGSLKSAIHAKYNAVAKRVMDRHRIPITHLHALSKAFPADPFAGDGSAKLAAQVAATIAKTLAETKD